MDGGLPSSVLVSAMLRRSGDLGAFGTVIARGDPGSGTILVVVRDHGRYQAMVERGRGIDGAATLQPVGPAIGSSEQAVDDYHARRRHSDPDLWIIELDGASATRVAAEALVDP